MKIVIGNSHERIEAASARVLSNNWQRCRVHFQSNALARVGKNRRRVVSAFIVPAFAQPDFAPAKAHWRLVANQMRGKLFTRTMHAITPEVDVIASTTFSAEHRTKLDSTSPITRLNGEIELGPDVVDILPNDAFIRHRVGVIINE